MCSELQQTKAEVETLRRDLESFDEWAQTLSCWGASLNDVVAAIVEERLASDKVHGEEVRDIGEWLDTMGSDSTTDA